MFECCIWSKSFKIFIISRKIEICCGSQLLINFLQHFLREALKKFKDFSTVGLFGQNLLFNVLTNKLISPQPAQIMENSIFF